MRIKTSIFWFNFIRSWRWWSYSFTIPLSKK